MKKIATYLIFLFCAKSLAFGSKKPDSYLPCEETVFWRAVCMAESGCNPNKVYRERNGTLSIGLYQLSIGAASQYGCDFRNNEDIKDPLRNEDCKNRIASSLKAKYPNSPWDEALGAYWGTMRDRRKAKWKEYFERYPNHTGFINLQYYAKKLGCVIP
jgi:Lysozyme like domain